MSIPRATSKLRNRFNLPGTKELDQPFYRN